MKFKVFNLFAKETEEDMRAGDAKAAWCVCACVCVCLRCPRVCLKRETRGTFVRQLDGAAADVSHQPSSWPSHFLPPSLLLPHGGKGEEKQERRRGLL